MALTQTQVSELYVAVFGRASEGEGNTYWATYETTESAATEMFTLDVVSNYFSVSNFTEEANVRTVVEAIYLNALGKAPADDVAGIQYWVDSIIVDGNAMGVMVAGLVASANDPVNAGAAQDTFNNKVAVSNYTADTVEAFSDFTTFQGLISSVDETTASVDAAKTEVDTLVIPVVDGETFSLTTEIDDIVVGTADDDVVTATVDTLNTGDTIIDQSSTDNDSLNLTLSAVYTDAATVSGIENVNIDVDMFTGASFNAAGVTGATITGSSSKLGYNGELTVDATAANNVVAGTAVTDLIVQNLTTGSVDTGSADTAVIDVDNDDDMVMNVTVNGDVDLTATFTSGATTSETLNLTAAAASVVTLNSASTVSAGLLTIAGSGDLSMDVDTADVTGQTITGVNTLNVTTNGGTLDAENFTVDEIEDSLGTTLAISNATGQTVSVTAEDADLTVDGENAEGESATVNVSGDQTAGSITLTDMDSFAVNLTSDVTEILDLAIEGDTTVTVAGDVELVDVNKATATDSLIIAGAGDVTVTDVDDVASVNSSALTGDLNVTATVAGDIEVIAGSGDDTVTVASTTHTAAVTTGNGTNTVDATSITDGTIAVTGGTGVDTVMLDIAATTGTATVAMAGGTGADVIDLADGSDITDVATWAVTGFTSLTMTDANGNGANALNANVLGSQLVGMTSLSVAADANDFDDDTLALTVDADEATTNLGGLVIADTTTTTVIINGQTTADDITGTNANDTITTNGGADTIDLSDGGADEVIVLTTDSNASTVVAITGFGVTTDTTTSDTLTLNVNANVVLAATDVDIDGDTIDDYSVVAVDGVISVTALTADGGETAIADIDDLVTIFQATADDNAAGEIGAIEWNGDTYVFTDVVTTQVLDSAVQLIGVTGVTAIDTTIAANTLVVG